MNRLGLSIFTRRPAGLLVIGLGIWAWAFLAEAALACSDKFVVLGSGVRFERVYKSEHPTRVLLYMNPASELSQIDKKTHLRAALRFAGHKPSTAATSVDVERVVQKGGIGVVLVAYEDVEAVQKIVNESDSKPLLLPVLFEPTDEELASATEKFGCPLRSSRRTSTMIESLDDALDAKGKGTSCVKPR